MKTGLDTNIHGKKLVKQTVHPAWQAIKLGSLALAVIGLLIAPFSLRNYGLILLCLWSVYTIAVQGLNLTLGYAGQISLAQAAFMGLGAYISTLLVQAGTNFWLAMIIAAVSCTLIGALIGFPALRVRSHYLSFVTLGFNGLIMLLIRNEEWLTNGTFGIRNITRPSIFGLSLDSNINYYYFCMVMLGLVTLAVWFMLRSPWGRAFKCLRDNPARAESLGISVTNYTLLAFALGSGIAAIAGVVYAPLIEFIEPAPFAVTRSLMFLLMVVVGGRGTLVGPFIGAFFVTLFPEWVRFLDDYYLVIFSLMVMLLIRYLPKGIAGLEPIIAQRFIRKEAA
ncbi:MAG: branched-chain amino acid ABC transporter permease [Anaerolineae bacterium]|nr:branched-chain amino acid ABC transporter permease [Anaerolineae bacterium]